MRVSSGSRGPAQARGSRETRRRSREGVSLRHQSCRSQALSWGREFGAATDSAPPGVLLQARGPGLPRLPMSALRVPDTLLSSALCLLLPVLKFTHRGPSLMGKGEKARLLRDSQKSQLQRKAQASLGYHPPPPAFSDKAYIRWAAAAVRISQDAAFCHLFVFVRFPGSVWFCVLSVLDWRN